MGSWCACSNDKGYGKMRYNVPFIPDRGYTSFLAGLGKSLHSVHFSLYSSLLNDGRVRMGGIDLNLLIEQLSLLQGPRKYLLANGRFHMPDQYLGQDSLSDLVKQMSLLQEAGQMDGIVFSDAYILMALAKQAPQMVSRLEAVPSINFILDNIEKIASLLQMLETSGFQTPAKLALDRELNRQPEKLKNLTATIRERFHNIKIELLANEGCLSNCPFRATHEALIAAANNGMAIDTLQINQQLGCVQSLHDAPQRILASPFIRPEDVQHYQSQIDIIKICGRSLGPDFLINTVKSYIEEVSPNNLLSLLDAVHWMSKSRKIDPNNLPDDFYQLLTSCNGDCKSCKVCRKLFSRAATELPLQLEDFRNN